MNVPEVLTPFEQIWQDYDEEAELAAQNTPVEETGPLKSEYLDVIISDVLTKNGFGFSVQILNTEGAYIKLYILNIK